MEPTRSSRTLSANYHREKAKTDKQKNYHRQKNKTQTLSLAQGKTCTVINYQASQQAGRDPYMGAVSHGRSYNVLSVIVPSVCPSRHEPLHTASFLSVLCPRTWQGNSSYFKTERDEEAETGSCSELAFPGKVV